MKLRENNITIEKTGNVIESMFGISEKDASHVLNILRDRLYSDKILAVMREYATNAQDAHIEAGKPDVPIKISLPSNIDYSFKVRDYGLGLSEDDIRDLYVKYGASTKRNTNDLVGCIGIGCKSGFSYSDTFNITSWHQGEKKVYCAYIDESDTGVISLLSTEESDEPEGVEISIPVNPADDYKFNGKAQSLYRYFEPIPEGVNITEEDYAFVMSLSNGIKFRILSPEKTYWSTKRSKIVMGGVPYQIDTDNLNISETATKLLNSGIIIFVNIGDVDVSASRESIEYTKHTIENVSRCINQIAEMFGEYLAYEIENTKTFHDANLAYITYEPLLSVYNKTYKNFIHTIKWFNRQVTGHVINKTTFEKEQNVQYLFDLYSPTENGKSNKWNDFNYLKATAVNKSDYIIHVPKDEKKNWKQKISLWAQYKNISIEDVFVIRWLKASTESDIKKLNERYFLDEYNLIDFSECIVPKEYVTSVRKPRSRSTSHIGKVFKLRDDTFYTKRKSSHWLKLEDKDIPTDTKYFVELDRFETVYEHYPFDGKQLFKMVDTVTGILEIDNIQVYGIKKKYVNKITKEDDTWKPLFPMLKNIVSKSDMLKEFTTQKQFDKVVPKSTYEFLTIKDSFNANTLAREYLDTVNNVYNIKKKFDKYSIYIVENIINMFYAHTVRNSTNKLYDLEELRVKAHKKYKIVSNLGIFPGEKYQLDYIDNVGSWKIGNNFHNVRQDVVDYVNKIEEGIL